MSGGSLARRAAETLVAAMPAIGQRRAVIGLDGFVDQIISVVDKRDSPERFTRVPTLTAMGQKIIAAAGKSTNIELVVERVKLGGNGPIMANALAVFGLQVTYIGNLGYPHLHPVFEELAQRATVHSIAEPGLTDALEFDDGKIMLGKHAPLRDVNWHNLTERVGRDRLRDLLARADLIGLQNWTMLPFMSEIWERMLTEIVPHLTDRHFFFFDLADPEKRDPRDIARALELIGQFQRKFDVYLGLNEKEAHEIGTVLGYQGPAEGEPAVRALATHIQQRLKITGVVIHPRAYAVAASNATVVKVDGPFVERPLISTGAGDHFNAGFCLGKLIGADDAVALQLGVATSGYYVRTARSPTASQLTEFLNSLG
ncbi:MAG: carbohydrate kinase family protein [Verrucomicrobiae bacterium]|nr:carbohydrate kinase family protein [Verrucomicrobiae bacterium]MDW8344670.1 hypothetical protein [Verrucomicrobiae bacterium]